MSNMSFWNVWDEIQNIRNTKWKQKAIELANEYIAIDPYNFEPYMQLIDMYYLLWELDKAEKPIDFLLSRKDSIWEWIDFSLIYYVKAIILSEKTQRTEAKKYIKFALKENEDNLEFGRLLATIEFWSWNKTKWYTLLKKVLSKKIIDPDVLLDGVSMALSLWETQDAKKYVDTYFKKRDKITFLSKSKSYYDRKMSDFKQVLFDDE